MTEKRFSIELQNNDIYDKETNTFYCDNDSICNLLNEQQATIEEWEFSFRTEMAHHRVAEKELQEKIREQQATIQSLKERLYDFEKRKIIEESEIDEDVIPKVKLLRVELFGEKYE